MLEQWLQLSRRPQPTKPQSTQSTPAKSVVKSEPLSNPPKTPKTPNPQPAKPAKPRSAKPPKAAKTTKPPKHADLFPSPGRHASTKLARVSIEINIPRMPRAYRPELAPPLAPITLTPPNDSTAYIRDRVILPGAVRPDGSSTPKYLAYIVGWSDYPAASVPVRADRVLDYVSPLVFEEFEYGLYLQHRRAQEEAEAAAAKASSTGPVQRAAPAKPPKKRGRPRLSASRKNLPEVPDEKPPIEKKKRGRPPKAATQSNGPSLSTPTKMRVDILEPDMDEMAEEEAILVQLYGADDREADQDYEPDDSKADSSTYQNHSPLVSRYSPTPPPAKRARHGSAQRTAAPSPLFISINSSQSLASSSKTPDLPLRSAAGRPSSPFVHHGSPSDGPATVARSASGQAYTVPSPHIANRKSTPQTGDISEDSETRAKLKRKRSKDVKGKGKAIATSMSPSPPPVEPIELDEPEYVIKMLEGVRSEFENGKRRRYFRVRWQGDWPADQNPTWEPERNLPKQLVKAFLRKVGNGDSNGSSSKGVDGVWQETGSSMARKYSSVAEAFEDSEGSYLHEASQEPRPRSQDEDKESFLVTDDPDRERGRLVPKMDPSDLGIALARAYETVGE